VSRLTVVRFLRHARKCELKEKPDPPRGNFLPCPYLYKFASRPAPIVHRMPAFANLHKLHRSGISRELFNPAHPAISTDSRSDHFVTTIEMSFS
jgi:hypothetical protein